MVWKGAWPLRGAGESQGGDAGGLCRVPLSHPTSGACAKWLWKVPGVRAKIKSICCMQGLGGLAWEHVGVWEKGSPRQGCVQGPPPCLEKRASELRSSGVCILVVPWTLGNWGLRKWELWAPTQRGPSQPELEAQPRQGVGQHVGVGDLVPTRANTGGRARSVGLPSHFLRHSFICSVRIVLPHLLSTSPVLGARGVRGCAPTGSAESRRGD